MRLYRLPVRETCRASNAFNVRHALITAFRSESTAAAVTVDTEKDPDRWVQSGGLRKYEKPPKTPQHNHSSAKSDTPPVVQFGGGFAGYETFQASFNRRAPREPHTKSSSQGLKAQSKPRPVRVEREPIERAAVSKLQVVPKPKPVEAVDETSAPAGKSVKWLHFGKPIKPDQRSTSEQKIASNKKTTEERGETAHHKPAVGQFGGPQTDEWKKHMQEIALIANNLAGQAKAREATQKEKTRLNYAAKVIHARESPLKESDALPLPWLPEELKTNEVSNSQHLESEISQFLSSAQPTQAEAAARRAVAEEARAFVKASLRQDQAVDTRVFGSEVTGLASATSDIDIRVYNTKEYEGEHNYTAFGKVMEFISRQMEESPDWICVSFRYSKYPIINAQHKASGLDVQLVSSPSTLNQEEWTKKYLAEIPNLRSLFFVLRTMFGMRGLIDVFNGGTGSYGLFMMLVASLRRRRTNPVTKLTSGEQLMHFFDFYSDFATPKHGLTIEPVGKPFLKHDGGNITPIKSYVEAALKREDPIRAGQWAIGQRRPLQPYLLCLQDPADPKNDLGRKSNAMKHVIATIRHHRTILRRQLDAKKAASGKSQRSLLLQIVGRCHEVYRERRKKVEEYGAEVLRREEAAKADEKDGDGEVVKRVEEQSQVASMSSAL